MSLLLLVWFGGRPLVSFAEVGGEITPESAGYIDVTTQKGDFAYGSDRLDNVLTLGLICDSVVSTSCTVLSTTTPFTILSYFSWDQVGGAGNVTCDGHNLGYASASGVPDESPLAGISSAIGGSGVYTGFYHCSGDLVVTPAETYSAGFQMQYVPYDTRLVATSSVVSTSTSPYTYYDWLYVQLVIIFLLSFEPIRFVFTLIFKRGWFTLFR